LPVSIGWERVAAGGFTLPHPPRDQRKSTDTGRAKLTVNELNLLEAPEGALILQTIRNHRQYNTTIYELNDRYRGIHAGRRVVLMNPDDMPGAGVRDGDTVDVVGVAPDGVERRAERFRVVSYSTPRGCVAAYWPEANVLVPLDSVVDQSGTPVSKAVMVRLVPRRAPVAPVGAEPVGAVPSGA
jgi:anaerobic selenocysteine-containing dehydrogenase